MNGRESRHSVTKTMGILKYLASKVLGRGLSAHRQRDRSRVEVSQTAWQQSVTGTATAQRQHSRVSAQWVWLHLSGFCTMAPAPSIESLLSPPRQIVAPAASLNSVMNGSLFHDKLFSFSDKLFRFSASPHVPPSPLPHETNYSAFLTLTKKPKG